MKRYFTLFLAAGVLLSACQRESIPSGDGAKFVSISPVITKATEVNFEDGDQIGLTIVCGDEAYATNYLMAYADGVFASTLEWYTLTDQTSTLTAYYPYDSEGVPTSFTVQTDQSVDGAYTASDLMGSTKSDVTPSYNAIAMVFKHQLTKILVNIDNTVDAELSSVVLKNSIPVATVDLDNLSVEADATASAADITAQAVTQGSVYRAIVVPQTVSFELVLTRSDGVVFSSSLASAELTAGGQYTVSAVLSADGLTVSLSGEIENWTDEGEIGEGDALEEHLDENYIIYHGETYSTVTLSNGTTWMAENMRYVPSGYSVSSDPTTGSIWYPYSMDYAQALEDGGGSISSANIGATYLNILTDEASIAEKGYLYSFEAIYGEALSEDNYLTCEDAQGICPDGWHIPNRAEYYDLVGYTNRNKAESAASTNSDALLWDSTAGYATVANGIDNGLVTFSGYKTASAYGYNVICSVNSTVEDYYGNQALTYYWTSTGYSSSQVFGLMTTFTTGGYPSGRLSLAYQTATFGAPLRCIRDHDIDFYATHSELVSPADYAATL